MNVTLIQIINLCLIFQKKYYFRKNLNEDGVRLNLFVFTKIIIHFLNLELECHLLFIQNLYLFQP